MRNGLVDVMCGSGRIGGMKKLLLQWAVPGIIALVGWGVSLMPGNTSWLPSSIIWGIAFVWFIIAVIYYVRQRGKTRVEPTKEIPKSENLGDTLTAMHRRLMELQKEKAVHTKVSFRQFKKYIPTLAHKMGTVTLSEWAQFNKDKKREIQKMVHKPKFMMIRNAKDWLYNRANITNTRKGFIMLALLLL